jgi:hypothetical protein
MTTTMVISWYVCVYNVNAYVYIYIKILHMMHMMYHGIYIYLFIYKSCYMILNSSREHVFLIVHSIHNWRIRPDTQTSSKFCGNHLWLCPLNRQILHTTIQNHFLVRKPTGLGRMTPNNIKQHWCMDGFCDFYHQTTQFSESTPS